MLVLGILQYVAIVAVVATVADEDYIVADIDKTVADMVVADIVVAESSQYIAAAVALVGCAGPVSGSCPPVG